VHFLSTSAPKKIAVGERKASAYYMKPAPGHRRINPNAAKRSPFAARGSGVDFAGAFWDLKSALVP
jgi:hypothetical protein